MRLPIKFVLRGRKQRCTYHTTQSLALRATISKLGTVIGWGWEGNDFVVHVQ
jgi:hypothetical protein